MPEDWIVVDDFRVSSRERLAALERLLAAAGKPDLEAVCEIDLHCHSFHSDGYCSPAMKVFEAWRRRMKGLAIADHDLFDGQPEAIAAGRVLGIEVMPAVEFYTDRPGVEILGFFPDTADFADKLAAGVFDEVVEPVRAAKKRQLAAMIRRVPGCFGKLGFKAEITPRDIDQYLRNGVSTKGDISVAMWQKYGPELAARGLAADVKDFQARYTTKDEYLNVPLEIGLDLSPAAFVRRISAWGGLAGLSHPTELRTKEGLDNAALRGVVTQLAEAGLRVVEVDGWRNGVCLETGTPQTDLFNAIRLEWNAANPMRPPLLFSNGSDDHNQPGEGLELGCGRGRNLRPEFGRRSNLDALRRAVGQT